ncbi:hypothetical protein NQZ68_021709 [Dissostichus eleginoides]|nr:hypothetical protein NQZ68_021709 [Dissostichus eleginoides]
MASWWGKPLIVKSPKPAEGAASHPCDLLLQAVQRRTLEACYEKLILRIHPSVTTGCGGREDTWVITDLFRAFSRSVSLA